MKENRTWNHHVVKEGNKSIVMEMIKNESPISRAAVASQTGLNKGTVSSLVADLMDDHLIYESGPGVSSGGRRPVMLLFNESAGHSIGIDLGVDYLLGILTDLDGNIIEKKELTFKERTYEEIEKKLFDVIDLLTSVAPPSPHGIIGIGVGVPGIVDTNGNILLAPNLNWKNINLKTALETKYGLPVIIENEANAGAYGEKQFGAGKDSENIIYVSAGIGIGVGLILNGSLYKGANGFSGELGHMTIQVDGPVCRCGNQGCWELYASEQALIAKAAQLNLPLPSKKELDLAALISLAENGNQEVIELFKEAGDLLGVGINNIINTFNPQQVIIGNRMASSNEWLEESLNKRVAKQALWFQQNDLQISFSELSTLSAALGVTAFSIENFISVRMQPKVFV
ncbi:ROK family protein [Planococcus sp. N028]|uniref:ROK family protein n=1 Tax=Planococcus shixiaomingii TaxID=3058393 RepID=A0ABT8N512_9BACL|nr:MULTISPECIES: ROK family protein [unclassified Planococcus (in: firmicutes)]MDN7242982.1 ROK family protein [Planococcus sp. N028]WKA56697.1 ROK family protein [Planococcus sp. N022]